MEGDMSEDPTAIRMDEFYPHPPTAVWRALTEPELIARWLMPVQGFRLMAGQEYTMNGTPMLSTGFSGTVAAKVLAVEPGKLLRVRWRDVARQMPGSLTATWRLEPEGAGTRVFMEQQGFDPDSPHQQRSRDIMRGSWAHIQRQLGEVVATL
jgi:uncharacterized protein YndB with AHSA1/START domain